MIKVDPVLRASMVIIGPDERELNDVDAWSIARPAIAEVIKRRGGGKAVSAAAVLDEANARAAEFFRLPAARHVLLTALSVDRFPARAIRVQSCVVTRLKSRRRYVNPDALTIAARHEPFLQQIVPRGYQLIRVSTSGRTVHESTATALAALDLLRGMWTLFATYGSWSMSGGPARVPPIGPLHLGPVQTLHLPDGRPADDIYWYQPNWSEDRRPFAPGGGGTNSKRIADGLRA
jgi:hypothetical protein